MYHYKIRYFHLLVLHVMCSSHSFDPLQIYAVGLTSRRATVSVLSQASFLNWSCHLSYYLYLLAFLIIAVGAYLLVCICQTYYCVSHVIYNIFLSLVFSVTLVIDWKIIMKFRKYHGYFIICISTFDLMYNFLQRL